MGSSAVRHAKEWIEMAKIPIEARRTYLDRRKVDVNQCKVALSRKDWETLERIGHKMKGNAETFGFEILAEVGIFLEGAAQSKNEEDVTDAVHQFEKALESLSADSEY